MPIKTRTAYKYVCRDCNKTYPETLLKDDALEDQAAHQAETGHESK